MPFIRLLKDMGPGWKKGDIKEVTDTKLAKLEKRNKPGAFELVIVTTKGNRGRPPKKDATVETTAVKGQKANK